MINKMKVACFSGHRKLPQNCTEIQGNLEKVIVELIEKGVVFFGCGGGSRIRSISRYCCFEA